MGETIEVTPERVDANYVDSETIIPAGRVVVKSTSSVLFENSMWPYFKVTDTSGNTIQHDSLDCRNNNHFSCSSDMTISLADLLGIGYTYNVTITPAEDSNGPYSEVIVNIDKEIENCSTLRITPNVDERMISGQGALISLQKSGDSQLILLPYWASMEPCELKVVPGAYKCCGFWNSYKDPETGVYYAPRVDQSFTCTSGEITEITLYLKELD